MRQKLGLTKAALARKIGINVNTLWRWEQTACKWCGTQLQGSWEPLLCGRHAPNRTENPSPSQPGESAYVQNTNGVKNMTGIGRSYTNNRPGIRLRNEDSDWSVGSNERRNTCALGAATTGALNFGSRSGSGLNGATRAFLVPSTLLASLGNLLMMAEFGSL